MTDSTSRRAVIGALACVPAVAVPAVAGEAISPKLAALVAEYRRATVAADMMNPEQDWAEHQASAPARAIAHEARSAIALYPAANRAEAMAKLGAIMPEWGADDLMAEATSNIRDGGHAYLDDVISSAVADLMRLGEVQPCA